MKKGLIFGAILGTALAAFAAKDPVIMRINGKDIKLSEFEYLYQKNNKQQIEKESLDQYVDRFVIYKLKVAEAEDLKLDTLQTFIKEYNGYKRELSLPYLEDTATKERLAKECYERMKRDIDVSNIFVNFGNDEKTEAAKTQKIDSLYQCLKNGEDIEELAYKYSEDRSAKTNRGKFGYIKVGMLPYAFEYEAYNTPVGQFSKPFKSGYGWHLLKVNAERPDESVLVEHILKLYPKSADENTKKEIYNKVQALYDKVIAGEDFEELAKKESEDPGSAKNGGKLPWFGIRQMVPEFEAVSFQLKNGEISKPFATQYGVHIVKKLSSKPIGSYEENKKTIENMISHDERNDMARNVKLQSIKNDLKYKENPSLDDYLQKQIEAANGNDSIFVATLKASDFVAYSIGGKEVSIKDAVKDLKHRRNVTKEGEMTAVKSVLKNYTDQQLRDEYINELYNHDSYFHNLLNEYYDGMLLFEISNRKIWDGAAKDTKGLQQYFEANKAKYQWNEKKYKGIIILAINDSIMQEAKSFLKEEAGNENKFAALKEKFKKQANVEYILAGKGDNPLVDYEIYKTGKKPTSKRYASSFIYDGKMIDAPETYEDVKVQVTSDYQNVLEKRWIESLKKKYPVVINKKVLKEVK